MYKYTVRNARNLRKISKIYAPTRATFLEPTRIVLEKIECSRHYTYVKNTATFSEFCKDRCFILVLWHKFVLFCIYLKKRIFFISLVQICNIFWLREFLIL